MQFMLDSYTYKIFIYFSFIQVACCVKPKKYENNKHNNNNEIAQNVSDAKKCNLFEKLAKLHKTNKILFRFGCFFFLSIFVVYII